MKYRTSGKAIDSMKTFKNLYQKLLDKDFIASCIWKASKGKRNRRDVKRVLNDTPYYVNIIYDMLETDSFKQPQHHVRTVVERGKERIIVKPNFIESVIHYMVMELLKPILMNRFDKGVCASIPGRGSSYGKKLVSRYIKKLQRKNHFFPRIYVFKIDIRRYFQNINRNILMDKLKALISDERFLNLMFVIIDCKEVPGLPLGFLTSQWLANFYLLKFDNYLTTNMKQTYYVRYMDDIVIVSDSKQCLHHVLHISKIYLYCNLDLSIKSNYQIFQLQDNLCYVVTGRPLDFMGFKFYSNRITLRKSILRSIRRTVLRVSEKSRPTIYDSRRVISRIGWLKQAETYKFYKDHLSPFINPSRHRSRISFYDRRHAA